MGVIARIFASSPSCTGDEFLAEPDQAKKATIRTHIPEFAVRIVLPLLPIIQEYADPTRVQKDGWGLLVLHDARLVPGQNSVAERHVVGVCSIDGDVCRAGMLGDEVDVAEAA